MSRNRATLGVKMISLLPDMVRRLRGEMTQAALAKRAGIARHTVLRIENDQAESVTLKTINRLAQALGVDADKLVTFR
jgi:transcriptional regulator with XRE-family HTH domain